MLKRILSWPLRRRRALGFGVHSPFAFRMIKETIGETPGYAYYSEKELRSQCGNRFPQAALALRMICRFNPSRLILAGPSKELLYAVEAADSRLAKGESFDRKPGERDLLLGWNLPMAIIDAPDMVPDAVQDIPILLVLNISRRQNKQLWRQLVADMDYGMDFTKGDVGIVCRLPHLPRQSFPLA